MIRREEARLNRVFHRLLLCSLAAPATIYACSSSSSDVTSTDGGVDATAGLDAQTGAGDGGQPSPDAMTTPSDSPSPLSDADLDASASDAMDAWVNPACTNSAPYVNDAAYFSADAGPDAGDQPYQACYYFVDLPCGSPAVETASGCYFFLSDCAKICSAEGGFLDCLVWQDHGCNDGSITANATDPITVACGKCNGVGRLPAGLVAASFPRGANAVGDYFMRAAHLEAASVDAFLALRDDLVALGAPRALVRMASRSARDEVRHARLTGRLAKRFGATTVKPRVVRSKRRSLEAIARENAVEGCVRETFGAMVATWQASHAGDVAVRAAMEPIAKDETRHAALAWAVAKWADRKLSAKARERVRVAQLEAVDSLLRDVSCDVPLALVVSAGVPTKWRARQLVQAMRDDLWAARKDETLQALVA